jgi:ATP-dependent RNA helicase RhlE
MMNFKQFELDPKITAGIRSCRYEKPTPIQEKAIPVILKGNDILGLAQTGTGKTAAFVLPILQRLLNGPRGTIRTLIVAPTRELAEQIHCEITKLGSGTGLRSVAVYGGVGKVPQARKIKAGAEIVVACPGRLLDHLNDRTFNLDKVEHLVLDEADHMFDMGFLPDLRRILKHLPARRQNLLFSATMPREIRHLAEEILNNPVRIQIDHSCPVPTVGQTLFPVEQNRKTSLLKEILAKNDMESTLIFTRTKHRARSLALQLCKAGYTATSLQGNLSQHKRRLALEGFKSGEFKVLVATDIAARGIDVTGISHVINFDVPDTVEAYTHRIGRTGRATRTGEAFTFAGSADRKIIGLIEKSLGRKMVRVQSRAQEDLPDAMPEIAGSDKKQPPQHGKNNRKKAARDKTSSAGVQRYKQRDASGNGAGRKRKNRSRAAILGSRTGRVFLDS